MNATRGSGAAACPRCGYDQRGVVATWRASCPLEGTCAECGLEFEWGELLSPARGLPRWCVESGTRPGAALRPTVVTLLRTYWPWAFWSSIRMSHPIRWRSVAAYLLLVAIGLYVIFSVANAWGRWHEWSSQAAMAQLSATTTGWPVFFQTLLLPLSDHALGTFVWRGTVYPYATPLQHTRTVWYGLGAAVALALLQQALCGLTFALLPVSRRRARVRWRHIFRVTLYGYGLFVLPLALGIVAIAMDHVGAPGWTYAVAAVTLSLFALPLLQIAWWSVATGTYLKMRHAWGVGFAVVIIGTLLMPIIGGLFDFLI